LYQSGFNWSYYMNSLSTEIYFSVRESYQLVIPLDTSGCLIYLKEYTGIRLESIST